MLSLDGIKNSEYSVFSYRGEDGIIQYIFNNIGTTNKFCVEFGGYDGVEQSNTFNLRLNYGWDAVLLDRKNRKYSYDKKTRKCVLRSLRETCSEKNIDMINLFLLSKAIKDCMYYKSGEFLLRKNWKEVLYSQKSVKHVIPKRLRRQTFSKEDELEIAKVLKLFYVFDVWITADNIVDIFNEYRVPQSFDLLSIDVDGNDYWLWKSLPHKARMVIIEFNSSLGPSESKVIPYSPDFLYNHDNYFGASLLALQKLGESKGYSLIWHNAPFNAFFVMRELLPECLRNISVYDIFPAALPHPKLKPCPPGKRWIET